MSRDSSSAFIRFGIASEHQHGHIPMAFEIGQQIVADWNIVAKVLA